MVGAVALAVLLLAGVAVFFGFWRRPYRRPVQTGREPQPTRTILHYLADASAERPDRTRSTVAPRRDDTSRD